MESRADSPPTGILPTGDLLVFQRRNLYSVNSKWLDRHLAYDSIKRNTGPWKTKSKGKAYPQQRLSYRNQANVCCSNVYWIIKHVGDA